MTTPEEELEYSENICHSCQKICKHGDPLLIKALGNVYHQECFKCDFCQVSVIEKFYLLELDNNLIHHQHNIILCEKDYYKHSRFKCRQCHEDIKNDNFQVIGTYKYHQHCLHCPGCTVLKTLPIHVKTGHEELPIKEYFDYNGRPYCRYHYSLIKGTECFGCGQAILQSELNQKWHLECYKIKKFWNIQLIDTLKPLHQSAYKNEKQLITIQNEIESKRVRIWKELSQFEENISNLISTIVKSKQLSNLKEEFQACQFLVKQINVIFTVLDSLFEHITHLSCDALVQRLSDQLISFLDILCSSNEIENMTKIVSVISDCIRDLIKLSLQQAIILERDFGEVARFIHHMLNILSNNQYKITMDIPYLDHHFQLIDMAMIRLSFVLNIRPQGGSKRPDQTLLFKPSTIIRPNSSFSSSTIKEISNFHQSSVDIHHSENMSTILQRSKSTLKSQHMEEKSSTVGRMESIRRALTTSRRKDPKQNQLQSAAYREHRSFSLQDTSKPLLHISLPNIEQLNHTTPPLSPPTTQHTYHLPNALPELTQQQDHLIRHIAIIFMDSYPIEDEDLLALLDIHKKSSTTTTTTTAASLWGKLKTHILTPTTEPIHAPLPSPTTSEKKIGVSLSNLSHGSLSLSNHHQPYNRVPENALFEKWRSLCPSIVTCFSSNSLVPHFLRDCILAMIQQDLNTEGIFRKNGNIRGLKEMCETLDSQPNREDWTDFFNKQPVVQLAAFIKRYLRELPEPLLTYKLYKLFLMSNKAANLTESLSMLHYSICLLPKPNRDILLLLLSLLNWVARHAETNKMDFGNLARVISPNILYESKKQTGYDISDVSLCHGGINVISLMIEHYDTFIKVPNEFNLFLEHPTLTECLSTNNIDLISTRQFTRSFNNLLKVKKEIMTSNHFTLPPSPSISSKYL